MHPSKALVEGAGREERSGKTRGRVEDETR
uniref:Uncharacterized protein n=1 Tax=Pseudomonas phage vB_PaPhi_Mx1 TaxID=3079664 RepID=A0AAU0N560_9CAUD